MSCQSGFGNEFATEALPGGASALHNCTSGHGPDAATFDQASSAHTGVAHKVADTMAFMFKTNQVRCPTAQALAAPERQGNYNDCWEGIASIPFSTLACAPCQAYPCDDRGARLRSHRNGPA